LAIDSGLDTIFTTSASAIKFGIGATNELGYELKKLDVKNALIITDKNIVEIGLTEKVQSIIENEDIKVDIYDRVHIEPTDISVKDAINFTKEKSYDGFVGLGGGSCIDTAKAVNLYTTYPAPLLNYISPPVGEGIKIPGPLRPLIGVPTTAGTGSEGTAVIIIDIADQNVKVGISMPCVRPSLGIIDPLNTLTMPPLVTASTGIDVFTHSMEAYTAIPYTSRPKPATPQDRPVYVGSNPISDAVSVTAIKIVGRYLRRSVMNGRDLDARVNMLIGATLAGVGFGNAGVHIPHSMAYPIAGLMHSKSWIPTDYNLNYPMAPHGLACAIGAPAVTKFTAGTDFTKHALIAEMLGEDIEALSTRDAAMLLPEAIIKLMRDINFPNGLSELGFTESEIPQLVEGTLKQQRTLSCSPRPVSAKDLEQMFLDSMSLW
jgi:hydroxyacid-oxoacid transhydrogenase